MNILLVEDERPLREALTALLRQQGYAVDAVGDGTAAEDWAMSGIYDAVILDVMLPRKNGLDVLRALRAQGFGAPVLLLTARAEVEDKISGLDCGADDYLTKPFASGELLARVRALTRRRGEYEGDELVYADMSLDKNTHELSCGGRGVKLGLKEYQIMETLMQNSRQIVAKERLMEKIWGFESDAEYNAIEVYVSFLRKKLLAIGSGVQIKAARGVGYSLEDGQ